MSIWCLVNPNYDALSLKIFLKTISHRVLSHKNSPDFHYFMWQLKKNFASLRSATNLAPPGIWPAKYLSGFLCSVCLAFSYIHSIHSCLGSLLRYIVHHRETFFCMIHFVFIAFKSWNLEALTHISVLYLVVTGTNDDYFFQKAKSQYSKDSLTCIISE